MRCRNIENLVARIEEIRAGAIPAFQKRLRERLGRTAARRRARSAAPRAGSRHPGRPQRHLRRAGPPAHPRRRTWRPCSPAKAKSANASISCLQEMNRESNTILSKTGGLGDLGLTITDLALAAKSEIDKIREQSLNLE